MIYDLYIQWHPIGGKWFFSFSIYLAIDFLVGARVCTHFSFFNQTFFFCWHELLHVLCLLPEVCEITGNLLLYLETTCSLNSWATSDSHSLSSLSLLHRPLSLVGRGVIQKIIYGWSFQSILFFACGPVTVFVLIAIFWKRKLLW